MEDAEDCLCCQEISQMKAKCDAWSNEKGQTPISCITQHPGFKSGCLDIWTLEIAYHQYKHEHGKGELKKKKQHQ